ncbi:MAG: SlyX family protein [Puniceicoccaceae bacterium]
MDSGPDSIPHLERQLDQLQGHVAAQDQEIFRLSKIIEKLEKRFQKLEGRLDADGGESPLLEDRKPSEERPPHY